jgi:hypothetical protein
MLAERLNLRKREGHVREGKGSEKSLGLRRGSRTSDLPPLHQQILRLGAHSFSSFGVDNQWGFGFQCDGSFLVSRPERVTTSGLFGGEGADRVVEEWVELRGDDDTGRELDEKVGWREERREVVHAAAISGGNVLEVVTRVMVQRGHGGSVLLDERFGVGVHAHLCVRAGGCNSSCSDPCSRCVWTNVRNAVVNPKCRSNDCIPKTWSGKLVSLWK